MKTKSIIANVALALTLGVLYTGCDKTKDALDTDTSSSADNSTSDNAFSGIFKSVSEASDNNAGLKSSCPTITIDTTVGSTPWPKTITIDYGAAPGCDGKSGKIIAVLSGRFRTSGSTITITTNNFYDGVNKVDAGTHTVTNVTPVSGHPTFDINVSGATVTTPSGVISWNTQRTITWIEGDTTSNPLDDVFLISGQANGTSIKGVTFTASITTPLRIARSCQWIESGVITLTPNGKKARTIDFGTTGCDNKATVSINGIAYPITM